MSARQRNADTIPLPLSDTLRDLAVLRALDIDLASVLPSASADASKPQEEKTKLSDVSPSEVDASVARSYEFVREAKAALQIINRRDVDKQGSRIDDVRSGIEQVLKGLGEE